MKPTLDDANKAKDEFYDLAWRVIGAGKGWLVKKHEPPPHATGAEIRSATEALRAEFQNVSANV
jgi:hypothetical protein